MTNSYLHWYSQKVSTLVSNIPNQDFDKAIGLLHKVKVEDKKVILIGNGGSAAICSHLSVDFTKSGKTRAVNFSDAGLQTCFSNDYGYENAYSNMLRFYSQPGDLLIAISSSGESANILNAVVCGNELDLSVITLSGFQNDNCLRGLGHINFYVPSSDYNLVENSHEQILLAMCDHLRLGNDEFLRWLCD